MISRGTRLASLFAGLVVFATACASVRTHEGPVVEVLPDARYDALFPYYIELCAVSQIRANFASHGGTPGHAAMYLKGACRDESTAFPTLKVCGDDVDLSNPESGSGVSVNKMLRNVNWIATPGKEMFYYGGVRPEEKLDADRAIGTIRAADAAGMFEGVEIHEPYMPPEGDEEQLLYLAGAQTLGTDFALNFGRTVYCARLPVGRRQLEDMVEYLNDLNLDYARGGADYNWSGYNDNCSHTLHNALAAAGVWKPKSIASYRLGQLANLSVPANEMANLSLLMTSFPIDDFDAILGDSVLRKTLARRSWLPTQHGALMVIIPVHQNNELYETEVAIFMLHNPLRRGKGEDVGELFRMPRNTELEANLLYFRDLYARILAERPEDWQVGEVGQDTDAEDRARDHYYRYIEGQLSDANEKLELLRSLE